MSVIGVDVGGYSTHIAVARLGAVEVIDNDYSLRPTPSVVAYGERQRFVGVSADNQKNLNPRNTVSNFKHTLGLQFKDTEALGDIFGARTTVDDSGRLKFQIRDKELTSEQVLATLFTKVKEIAKNAENEEMIDTLVVSVPVYFTQSQRQAVKDAAAMAGLHVNEIVSDATALALEYGKNKNLTEEKRNVVIVDVGSEGTQAFAIQFDNQKATVLATAHNEVGGRSFDADLVEHAIKIIEDKYKVSISDNVKIRNKLKNVLEKTKKQMSANTNKIPVQIDSLVDEIDVNFSIDRSEFEKMIETKIAAIRETLQDLMKSTTLNLEDLHSVEIVGGSTRIPIIKQVIQEVTGLNPSTTMNADEANARGCALYAASLSSKFITKKYDVVPAVHYGIEAMFVHSGQHERIMVCDKGESIKEEVKLDIKADLPLNIALQYTESSGLDDKFIALYKVDQTEASRGNFSLKFKFNAYGVLELVDVILTAEEQSRKRLKSDSNEAKDREGDEASTEMKPCRTILDFTRSMPEPANISELHKQEMEMVKADNTEIQRQEEKNKVEELLFKCRHEVQEHADLVGEEEAYTNTMQYFEEIENWLYEEGEDAPRTSYLEVEETLHNKIRVFSIWLEKFKQMKAREEEKRRFMEEQEAHHQQREASRHRHPQQPSMQERQIPVVFEGQGGYVPTKRRSPSRFANRPDPFFSSQDQFFRGSPFGDSLFGW